MKKLTCGILSFCLSLFTVEAQHIIRVKAEQGDMTTALQEAIHQAAGYQGEPVVIELQNTDYHISRAKASRQLYYASNTTSEKENPNPVKSIGLWLKKMKNVTIDGKGARLVTHGEMTSFVIDSCQNITFRNFTVTSADPSVPEMKVLEVGDNWMTARIHHQSHYRIENGMFRFVGEGWDFSEGIAQIYDTEKDITWRSWSPLSELKQAVEVESGVVRFQYAQCPQAEPGMTFQMRDGIRNEVCGLIQYSKDITLENLHLAFLGNFSVLGQMSENLTYRYLSLEPELGSGRTCAGFADFIHFSGCKGRITVENSRFRGAHDDAINVHGTHLSVTEWLAPDQVKVRYMHPQTYGFQSFFPGDDVELVNAHTLLPAASFKIKKAEMKSPREIVVTFDRAIPHTIQKKDSWVLENVTYTPEVVIRNNYFSRIPTRGILVTTRKKVLIENNTFFRTQMSGVLIADDARSWFESGRVGNVTIRNNRFLECGAPVIFIAPENDVNEGCVHRNIRIENNLFRLQEDKDAIVAKSVDGLYIQDNFFQTEKNVEFEQLVRTKECKEVKIEGSVQRIK